MIGSTLLERYEIESELGRGAMGVVYRARDRVLDRTVAIKALGASLLDADDRTRLLREAQAAAQLNHPHIVAVYDAGESEGEPFVVMEFVRGHRLRDVPPLPLPEALAIARQLCDALAHAHARGIVHRDVKPENVLVVGEEGRRVAKLADFGLARSAAASKLTVQGAVVGTAAYLAPEQALGRPVDGRTDLYSLGCLLYELLAGRPPFIGDALAVISQHLNAPVVPPTMLRPELPPEVDAIVLRLLAKDPDARFSSATEAGEALRALPLAPARASAPETRGGGETVTLLAALARGRLVGRGAELANLRELWAEAGAGRGRLALLSGEPGIGKSRLAHELVVYARVNGATVLRGGCYEYEATTPYLPFVEALRSWVREQPADELRARLGSTAPELNRLAPEIEAKLGQLPVPPELPPAEQRLRLFDSAAQFLRGLARVRPVLLFLDDLHWADAGSLQLLHYLLRQIREERVLVLGAYREVELDRTHPLAAALVEWNRERLALRIPLGRLSLSQSGELLAALFGQDEVSEDFARAMHRETEGNPFFLEEVVKSLIEQGEIYRSEGQWERKAVGDLSIPQSVREAIGRRLTRLDADCLAVLHTAAALGKHFAFGELFAASTLGEDATLDAIDEASAAQLVRAEDADTFVFTHDKIREVLYEELNPVRRRRLHLRIGEALERLHATALDRHAADLAHHFLLGGDTRKALGHALRAAERAEQVFAHSDALVYYQHAHECAEALEDREALSRIAAGIGGVYATRGEVAPAVEHFERAASLTPDTARRAELTLMSAAAFINIGDERGAPILERALEMLDRATQGSLVAEAMALMGRYHHLLAHYDEAVAWLDRARELAEPLGDPRALTSIYIYLAGAYQHLARLPESLAWARRSIELGERTNYPRAVALGHEFLAEDSVGQGHWERAIHHGRQNAEIAVRTGDLQRSAWALWSECLALHGLGQLAECEAATRETIARCVPLSEERLSTIAHSLLASVLGERGRPEEAAAAAREAVARAERLGYPYLVGEAYVATGQLALLAGDAAEAAAVMTRAMELAGDDCTVALGAGGVYAEALVRAGRLDEADAIIARTYALARLAESPHCTAEARCAEALLRRARGDAAAAGALLGEAIAAFEQLGSRLELARALVDRSAVREARGDGAGAAQDHARALALFEETGAAAELEDARTRGGK